MHFTFKKVLHFTRLIKAGGRLREFNFRKMAEQDSDFVFHVDVADDRGERIVFRLGKTEAGWQQLQLPALPLWVEEVLPQLGEIIIAGENGNLDAE